MFQQVTEVFGLESLIGGTPEATIFQFAFCLILYNQAQLVRAYVAKHQQVEPETVSLENLFLDIKRELIAWTVVVSSDVTAALPQRTVDQVRQRLDHLLRKPWSDRWIKFRNKQPRAHPSRPRTKTRTTVYRALQRSRGT